MAKLTLAPPASLTIELDDGQRFALHPIWLRERCRDARSVDLKTGQRLHDPSDIDLMLRIEAVSEPVPGRLRVRFSDAHEADFLAHDILEEAALSPGDHDVPATIDSRSLDFIEHEVPSGGFREPQLCERSLRDESRCRRGRGHDRNEHAHRCRQSQHVVSICAEAFKGSSEVTLRQPPPYQAIRLFAEQLSTCAKTST